MAPLLQSSGLNSGVPQAQWGAVGAGETRAHNQRERKEDMKKLFAAVLSVAVALSLSPALVTAQSTCPAEVTQAKDMLSKRTASVKPDDIQAPRSLAGARSNEGVQSPRGNQDVQSPRGNQDIQAPRSIAGARSNEGVQSPRGNQDVQSPRGNQDIQAPRSIAGARSNEGVQ